MIRMRLSCSLRVCGPDGRQRRGDEPAGEAAQWRRGQQPAGRETILRPPESLQWVTQKHYDTRSVGRFDSKCLYLIWGKSDIILNTNILVFSNVKHLFFIHTDRIMNIFPYVYTFDLGGWSEVYTTPEGFRINLFHCTSKPHSYFSSGNDDTGGQTFVSLLDSVSQSHPEITSKY